jgi:hypothetical protein
LKANARSQKPVAAANKAVVRLAPVDRSQMIVGISKAACNAGFVDYVSWIEGRRSTEAIVTLINHVIIY